jgi:uncharacterized protein
MNTSTNGFRWAFAHNHPVLTFLLITFAWSWLFWLGAIPFKDRSDLLVMSIVMVGGYGPAIGGILTLGLKKGLSLKMPREQMFTMVIAATVIFAVMALTYQVGNVPNYRTLAGDLTLTVPIVLGALLASILGGWVVSNAFSRSRDIRTRMASILPWRLPLGWTLFALFFFAGMILASWGLAALLGMDVEYPGMWGQPLAKILPLYLLTFALTGLAQGGNEEPGWRGMMQPEMQRRFSPLVAALIVSFFWSLWHLPLHLNGFYPEDIVPGMLGGGIYRILLAIFLAWFYNRSGGSIFLMIFMHTCFNQLVNFLPVSDIGLLVLWIVIVVVIVLKDKMYRKPHLQSLSDDQKVPVGDSIYTA